MTDLSLKELNQLKDILENCVSDNCKYDDETQRGLFMKLEYMIDEINSS